MSSLWAPCDNSFRDKANPVTTFIPDIHLYTLSKTEQERGKTRDLADPHSEPSAWS